MQSIAAVVPVGTDTRTLVPGLNEMDRTESSAFSALMAQKRQEVDLSANPLVEVGMRLSAEHTDMVTKNIVEAFEKSQNAKTASQRYVTSLEVMDAVATQSSRVGMVQLISKAVLKNIDTLTTRMS